MNNKARDNAGDIGNRENGVLVLKALVSWGVIAQGFDSLGEAWVYH